MPNLPFNVINPESTLEQLLDELAKVQRKTNYLMNKGIDTDNINFLDAKVINAESITADKIATHSITADKMNVDELSAIAANLGHITAGLIEAVQIFGSYIATANGTFPRSEMSSITHLFAAYSNADSYVALSPNEGGAPAHYIFDAGILKFLLQHISGVVAMLATTEIQINANGGDLRLDASGNVSVPSWTKLVNRATGNTLQQDLNDKLDETGAVGSFTTADGKTVTVVNGAITGIS